MNAVIVDDEAIVRLGIRHSIDWAELGIGRVEEATHGKEVLEHWDIWQPKLLVTDIKMPVMDGISLIREVRKKAPDCICIVLSCVDEFNLVKEALLAGAVDYLLKMTMRPTELMDSMRKVIQQQKKEEHIQLYSESRKNEKKQVFFKQWFTQRYSEQQMELMAQECGMTQFLDSFSIAVIQTRVIPPSPASQSSLQWDSFEKWWMEEGRAKHYLLYPLVQGEYALLINRFDELSDNENALQQLQHLFQQCSNRFALKLRAGISSIVHGPAFIQQALDEARRAVKEHLFEQNCSIISYDCSKEQESSYSLYVRKQFDQAFREQLARSLLTGSSKETDAIIDAYFGLLHPDSCSAEAVRDCIDKSIAIVSVAAMEIASLTDTISYSPIEEFEEGHFQLYWSCAETVAYIKRYCHYLMDIRQNQMNREDSVIRQICTYIQQHYNERITLEQMAARHFLHKNYLCQLFKTESGMNFTRYLNSVRIAKAKELMLYTSLSMQEIAMQTGYGDFRYFSRVFRLHTGQSPSAFKTSQQKHS